jgi:hypothetical protein
MKRFFKLAEATVIVLALVAVSIVLSLLAKGSNDLPAWVQAVGSVAAILAAFMIANSQSREQLKLERANANDEARRKIKTLRSLLIHLKQSLEIASHMRASSPTRKTGDETVASLRSLHSLLERLPIFEVPLDELIIEFHHIQRFVPILCEHFELERTLTHPHDSSKRAFHESEARNMLPGLIARTGQVITLCDAELLNLP